MCHDNHTRHSGYMSHPENQTCHNRKLEGSKTIEKLIQQPLKLQIIFGCGKIYWRCEQFLSNISAKPNSHSNAPFYSSTHWVLNLGSPTDARAILLTKAFWVSVVSRGASVTFESREVILAGTLSIVVTIL